MGWSNRSLARRSVSFISDRPLIASHLRRQPVIWLVADAMVSLLWLRQNEIDQLFQVCGRVGAVEQVGTQHVIPGLTP